MIYRLKKFLKIIFSLSLLLPILFITGCKSDVADNGNVTDKEVTFSPETTEISLDGAKQIALTDAGVDENDVTFIETKTDYEYGIQVYDLNFYTSDAEYEYEIRVSDGSIYSRDIDYLDGREKPGHITPGPDTSDVTGGFDLALEDAIQIALTDAGVSELDATIVKSEIDYENGQQVYDIKFYTLNAEYEYEINASNGSIYSREAEHYRGDDSINDTQQSDGEQIDLEGAKAIAVEHAKADPDDVTFKEAKKDRDDGVYVYEIEFYFSGREYEYKIRCFDGKILEYDVD